MKINDKIRVRITTDERYPAYGVYLKEEGESEQYNDYLDVDPKIAKRWMRAFEQLEKVEDEISDALHIHYNDRLEMREKESSK